MKGKVRGKVSTIAVVDARVERFSEKVDKRFEGIDRCFKRVDERFDQIDARFAQVDQRFERVEERFAQVENRIETLAVMTAQEFTALRQEIAASENRILSRVLQAIESLDLRIVAYAGQCRRDTEALDDRLRVVEGRSSS